MLVCVRVCVTNNNTNTVCVNAYFLNFELVIGLYPETAVTITVDNAVDEDESGAVL